MTAIESGRSDCRPLAIPEMLQPETGSALGDTNEQRTICIGDKATHAFLRRVLTQDLRRVDFHWSILPTNHSLPATSSLTNPW